MTDDLLSQTSTTVCFLPNWVGDAVMATPALRALREQTAQRGHFGPSRLIGVMRPAVAATLAGCELFADTILFDPRSKNVQHQTRSVLAQLQRSAPQRAMLFPNSIRTAWLAWRSGAKERIGLGRDGRGWLLTRAVQSASRATPHSALNEYVRIAEAAGAPVVDRQVWLKVTPQEQLLWQDFVSRASWDTSRPLVALSTGGAFGPAKAWPKEHFVALAKRLIHEDHVNVVLVCGPAEQAQASWITEQVGSPCMLSTAEGPPSIGLTKAALQAATVVVTTDSGPRHIACALGRPVVTLFGPTHPGWSENGHQLHTTLQLAVECGPCQQRACPRGHHRCMTDLTVERVLAAARGWLATASQTRSLQPVAWPELPVLSEAHGRAA